MMKRLLISLLAALMLYIVACFVRYYTLPPEVQAQTNTFCAANLTCSVTGAWNFTGTLGTTLVTSLNNVQMCDQFAGATADLKIAACIAALPAGGGTADARGLQGAQSFASTLVLNKPGTTLLLGAAKITGPASGQIIDVQAGGNIIKGVGTIQNTGATQGTVLVAVTSAQADGIHLSATGGGNVQYKVLDLTINDSTAGGTARTAGAGINADAAASPAQNSIGEIDNVYVSFMFTGIRLNRPITSTVLHATSVQSKQDDFDFQGDGTSTWCIQCYGNFSGRFNFAWFGLNYAGCIGCASDHAVSDGYHVARQSDTTGNQSIAIFITNTGAETDSTGGGRAGVYALDVAGFYFSGKVLNAQGQGIWIDGVRTATLSGSVSGSTSNDINVTTSATPIIPGGIVLQSLQYVTSGGGSFSTGTTILGWIGANAFVQFGTAGLSGITPGTAGGLDLGTAALPWGNLWLGTAATNNFKFQPATTTAARVISMADPGVNVNMPYSINALTFDAVYGTYRIATDQTITAGASLTNIPGLTWTMPANTALNASFSCHLLYNETTAATSMQFGIQDVTVAPTNIMAKSQANLSASTFTAGNLPALTTTTATAIVTLTPSAATTVWNADIDGTIEQPSNAATSAINIMAQFTTNNGVIKRGSYCQVF